MDNYKKYKQFVMLLKDSKDEFYNKHFRHIVHCYRFNYLNELIKNFDICYQMPVSEFTVIRITLEIMKDIRMKEDIKYNKLHVILNKLLHKHLEFNIKNNPKCQNNISHMHIACMVGNIKVVNYFIEAGVDINETIDINAPMFPGFSPMHFAVRYNHLELVQKFLHCGADINLSDGNEYTPLRLLVDYIMQINDTLRDVTDTKKAVFKINTLNKSDKIMEMLMTAMESSLTNLVDDFDFSYLHASCTRKDQIYVETLLEIGANINEPVKFEAPMWPGYTPLHFAARCNLQTFMLLLRKGANLAAKDAYGMTALDLCTERYKPAEISRILKMHIAGLIQLKNDVSLADIFSMMETKKTFEKFVSTVGVEVCVPHDSPIWPSYTLLHLAVLISNKKKQYSSTHFVFKNQSWEQQISTYFDEYDDLPKICMEKNSEILFWEINGMTLMRLAYLRKSKNFCNLLLHIYATKKYSPNWILQQDEIWYQNIILKAGSTVLHIAALAEANKVILEYSNTMIGDEISVPNAEGLTPAQLGFVHCRSKNTLANLLLIRRAQKINNTTKSNLTHLHIACYAGNIKAVKHLLQVAKNINKQIKCVPSDPYNEVLTRYEGYTPLHFAVQCGIQFGCTKIVTLLLKKGANVLIKNKNGLSPLHFALQDLKAREIPGIIINQVIKNVNDDFKDDFGITRLHLAYFVYNRNLIKKLLKAGENVNSQINFDSPIYPGDTPHHLLAKRFLSDQTIPKLLLQHEVDFTLKNADNLTTLMLLQKYTFYNTFLGPLDQTRLLKRKILDTQKKNEFFIKNLANEDNFSHLHICCFLNNLTCVKKFLEHGADVNIQIDYASYFGAGYTPLHIAAITENHELLLLLLEYGANVSIEDIEGLTAMHHAAGALSYSFTQISIDNMLSRSPPNFDFFYINEFGNSIFGVFLELNGNDVSSLKWILDKYKGRINLTIPPFDLLFKYILNTGREEPKNGLHELIKEGIDIDVTAKDSNDRNAIFTAVSYLRCRILPPEQQWNKQVNILEILVNAGCELDHRDCNGRTALHEAVSSSNFNATSILLAIGIDVNICDNAGHPAYKYSTHALVSEILEKHVIKMMLVNMYLNESNAKMYERNDHNNSAEYLVQIMLDLGLKKIVPLSTFHNVLNENLMLSLPDHIKQLSIFDLLKEKLVLNFSSFDRIKRSAILELLGDKYFVDTYKDWRGLFRFQHRRLRVRVDLIKFAAENFHSITELPLVCAYIVVENLKNEDLKSLIEV